ncbi:MAG TPA: bifunctional tRNA (5-methylaminomethyl-2-thiouridine)(34)-methyltransferase MnmD/FAD-dependent 5-carboxymethylaminomethyl-2-thiouridine(34) oxidoreductase MnmC [Burkholderiales bacterium]|nr:bifunctional tRNA (5-methylaminomethyl-2-thiouridine)(34)-methyltransferase MnmD/FAD-dependent 5-carboxymethylaminomethyl-2-thiouridine(34) oxidoreductase MnmC [Burkholderiales bacterium]
MTASLVPATIAFLDETPYSTAFDDVYHSAAGGPAQAEHVFLRGNGLPQRWAGRERFVVLETGFGLGLNFLVTLQAWRRNPGTKLHYVSVEKHPFTLHDLQTLHQRYPSLREEAAELHSVWPMLLSGGHRAELDQGRVVLTLFFADIKVLRDLRLSADAIYLDGFSPAKNPDMWSSQVMRAVSRLAAPEATAATWSVATEVRASLERVGFAVEKRAGFGHKKEMLVARNTRQTGILPERKNKEALVVGAGLAGAAICERLCARGWQVELVERHAAPAQEASGNPAGAFHPVVTPDDSLFARLTRAGFLFSLNKWKSLGSVRWDQCGLLQLARDEREAASQGNAVDGLPREYAQVLTREEASAHAGVPAAAGGVWFPEAGWIDPPSLVRAQLEACGAQLKRQFGKELKELPADRIVILANSFDAPKLQPVPHLRLRRVRGQLTYVPAQDFSPPRVVLLRGGMVLPPVDGACVVGASFDIDDADPAPRAESHAGNLERLARIVPFAAELKNLQGRVAFRSVTPDRLPVVGAITENVYGAFAYGSRGLVWAALAAELIASHLEGEPLPLEGKLVDALSPLRFRMRAGETNDD